ncbi:MAG: VCBS repeat-containing protein [Deltaproteobacteria bacterium]|nr:VCBS repeat-containing protein [Deltaproteobacteria bacterium]
MRARLGFGPAALVASLVGLAPGGRAERSGTLDQLADGFDRRLEEAARGVRRARVDLGLTVERGAGLGRSGELVGVVRRLVLARLVRRGYRSVSSLPAADTAEEQRLRARRAGFELLVAAELVLSEGHLHLRGVLLPTDASLFRDAVQPERGAIAHLDARVRADAEVRAYLGQPAARRTGYALQGGGWKGEPVLDLAVADLDRDGRPEVVALHARSVSVVRSRGGGHFATVESLGLAGAGASRRPRRALGTLRVADLDGDGVPELLLRSSEYADGAELVRQQGALRQRRSLAGFPVATVAVGRGAVAAVLSLSGGGDFFSPADLSVGAGAPSQASARRLPAAFYMAQRARVGGPGGGATYWGTVDLAGRLEVHAEAGGTTAAVLAGSGVAFALGDLDDDGGLEVVSTLSGDGDEHDDRLLIHALGGGAPRLVWRSPELPGRVTAVACGDLDGDGRLDVVASVEDREGRASLYGVE